MGQTHFSVDLSSSHNFYCNRCELLKRYFVKQHLHSRAWVSTTYFLSSLLLYIFDSYSFILLFFSELLSFFLFFFLILIFFFIFIFHYDNFRFQIQVFFTIIIYVYVKEKSLFLHIFCRNGHCCKCHFVCASFRVCSSIEIYRHMCPNMHAHYLTIQSNHNKKRESLSFARRSLNMMKYGKRNRRT